MKSPVSIGLLATACLLFTHSPLSATQASLQAPAHAWKKADVDTILIWPESTTAEAYDVYFGTTASLNSAQLKGRQTANTYVPGRLSTATRYWWRIDAVDNQDNVTTGDVWYFDTVSKIPGTDNLINMLPPGPSDYLLRDWKNVILQYNDLITDFSASGPYQPVVWWDKKRVNFDIDIPYIPSFVGITQGGDALNLFPAIVGASLAGIDKSNEDGHDWVRAMKQFQGTSVGRKVIGNNKDGQRSTGLWYDVAPGIYFAQAVDLYPDVATIETPYRFQNGESDPVVWFSGEYQQNFNGLHPTTLATALLPSTGFPYHLADSPFANSFQLGGWYVRNKTTNALPYRVYAEAGTGSGYINFGNSDDPDRALGAISNGGTAVPMFGVILQNMTDSVITEVFLSYSGEQWRGTGETVVLEFSYATGDVPSIDDSSTFQIPGGDFDFAASAPAGSLNGKSTGRTDGLGGYLSDLSWQPGEFLILRWSNSIAGSGLAIDDLSVTAADGPEEINVNGWAYLQLPYFHSVSENNWNYLPGDAYYFDWTGEGYSTLVSANWPQSHIIDEDALRYNGWLYLQYPYAWSPRENQWLYIAAENGYVDLENYTLLPFKEGIFTDELSYDDLSPIAAAIPLDTDAQGASMEDVMYQTADRWYDVLGFLGGETNGISDFNGVVGFNTVTMEIDDRDGTHPGVLECAAGLAWIQYMAYIRFGEEKFLTGTQWALNFLDTVERNPMHNGVQMGYGALAMARMNAELGFNYDLDQMFRWIFGEDDSGNPLRDGWGVLYGFYGNYEVSGLIGTEGQRGGTNRAYAKQGFNLAGSLVPMTRYDSRYAKAVGKWILHLASSSRHYYQTFIENPHTDSPFFAGDPNGVIPFESLRGYHPKSYFEEYRGFIDSRSGSNQEVRAKVVQAIQNPPDLWASGRSGAVNGGLGLCLYFGGDVGFLSAVVDTTNVAQILQLDLLATDFFRSEAYPSFLYYNPWSTEQSVQLDLGSGNFRLYDTVRHEFIASGVSEIQDIAIPANEARILVIVPQDGDITYSGRQMMVNSIIVDYYHP